jgi:hypothetical protein
MKSIVIPPSLPVKKLQHFIYFICYTKHLGDDHSMGFEISSKFEIEFAASLFLLMVN